MTQTRQQPDSDGGRSRSPARIRAVFAAALVLFAVQLALTFTGAGESGIGAALSEAILIIAMAAMVVGFAVGAAHSSGDERLAWRWFAAGGLVYVAGEIAWSAGALGSGGDNGASLADVFWLAAFPFYFIALHVRYRASGRHAARGEGWLESLIVMGVFGLVLWEAVLQSAIEPGEDLGQTFVNLAYPVGDLGLVWLLLRGVYRSEHRWGGESGWLIGGFFALVGADTVWALSTTAELTALSDLLYVSSALMLAMAGLSVARGLGTESQRPSASRPLLFDLMPYLAGVAVGLVPIWQIIAGSQDLDVALLSLVVLILVFVRLAMTVRQNRLVRAQAEHAAMLDGLTGLWNHRYFQERLRAELARAEREQSSVGVLMIDIDRFKRFNDSAGHLAGDRLLRELGEAMRASVRPSDTAARVGGDELAVIAPGAREETLLAVADRIAVAAAGIRIETPDAIDGERLEPSVSIGACVYPAGAGKPTELIEHADAALYRSKRRGRGRITLYEPEAEAPTSPSEELAAARETIKARELDFHALFEAARDPLLIVDDRGRILDANPATRRMTGLSGEQLCERSIFDFAGDGASPTIDELRRRAIDAGHLQGVQEIRLPDGTVRIVDFTTTTFSPGRHLLTVRDVTERQEAQRQIAESETKFRSLFEHAADAIYVTDDEGAIVDANAAAVALGGIDRRELIGAKLGELVAAGDATSLTGLHRELRADGAQRGIFEAVWPDGSKHAVEYTAVADFVPGRHLSIVRDVTDQVSAVRNATEREALYRAVTETISEGIAVIGPDGTIRSVNRAAVRILGRDEPELVGRSILDPAWEAVDERGRRIEPGASPLARMLEDGDAIDEVTCGMRRPDGKLAWVRISARHLEGEGDERPGPSFVVGITAASAPPAAVAGLESARP